MSRIINIAAAAATATVLLAPALASAQALFNAYPRPEYVQQWNNDTMSGAHASATRANPWRASRHAQRGRTWHAADPSGDRDAMMNFDIRRGNVM
jgi:hypothetical protein